MKNLAMLWVGNVNEVHYTLHLQLEIGKRHLGYLINYYQTMK
jgi:hypothetical protein